MQCISKNLIKRAFKKGIVCFCTTNIFIFIDKNVKKSPIHFRYLSVKQKNEKGKKRNNGRLRFFFLFPFIAQKVSMLQKQTISFQKALVIKFLKRPCMCLYYKYFQIYRRKRNEYHVKFYKFMLILDQNYTKRGCIFVPLAVFQLKTSKVLLLKAFVTYQDKTRLKSLSVYIGCAVPT